MMATAGERVNTRQSVEPTETALEVRKEKGLRALGTGETYEIMDLTPILYLDAMGTVWYQHTYTVRVPVDQLPPHP